MCFIPSYGSIYCISKEKALDDEKSKIILNNIKKWWDKIGKNIDNKAQLIVPAALPALSKSISKELDWGQKTEQFQTRAVSHYFKYLKETYYSELKDSQTIKAHHFYQDNIQYGYDILNYLVDNKYIDAEGNLKNKLLSNPYDIELDIELSEEEKHEMKASFSKALGKRIPKARKFY